MTTRVELEHHYGWKIYDTDAADLPAAAQVAIRRSHAFLSDRNHRMEIEGGRILVKRTADAEPPAITPLWARPSFKAGAVWFSVPFRTPPLAPAPHAVG